MDIYQLIAALVGSLAWPASALAMAAIARRPLIALLSRARSAEGFGAKLTFGEEASAIQEVVEAVAMPPAGQVVLPRIDPATLPAPSAEERERGKTERLIADELATTSATGTIVLAWREVEAAVSDAAEFAGIFHIRDRPQITARSLLEHGFISHTAVEAIDRLRTLRNKVAHGAEAVSLMDAIAYRDAANAVIGGLQQWQRNIGRAAHPE